MYGVLKVGYGRKGGRRFQVAWYSVLRYAMPLQQGWSLGWLHCYGNLEDKVTILCSAIHDGWLQEGGTEPGVPVLEGRSLVGDHSIASLMLCIHAK